MLFNRTQIQLSRIPSILLWMVAIATFILFCCSLLKHALFHSTAFDLTFFDQAIYLISQGKPAIVSLTNYHFLGSHAAWILYVLALPYILYTDVHWLFLFQAAALSSSIIPLWILAREGGLSVKQGYAIALSFLLYPLIFNINLFDFHPSVFAPLFIFTAILAAKKRKIPLFTLTIILLLGCRAAFSLTVIGMGLWLLFIEKRRYCGTIALFLGIAWFIIATQVIIPQFRPQGVEALGRYGMFGDSLPEIIVNLFLKPHIVFKQLFTPINLEYLLLLFSPVIWGIHPRYLTPLVATIPDFCLNLLTDYPLQKDLLHQYSLPILPFLMLCVISSVAAKKSWFQRPRWIVLWGLLGFLALAKFGYFWTRYLETLGTWQETREAIALVNTKDSVLTSANIAPHLSHRTLIRLVTQDKTNINAPQFHYVLLNKTHPGWNSTPELVQSVIDTVQHHPEFKLKYEQNGVYLFVKN